MFYVLSRKDGLRYVHVLRYSLDRISHASAIALLLWSGVYRAGNTSKVFTNPKIANL